MDDLTQRKSRFVKISRYAGMREDLVQASGGNSSVKLDESKMLIKASGFQLAELTDASGYATVDYRKIRDAFLSCDHLDDISEKESKDILTDAFIDGNRPSIETFLHSISGTYTLHTHPIVVNALTCRKGGMETIEQLFPEALIVPYATPGVELAKAFFKAYKKKSSKHEQIFDVVLLQNHGLVISADTAEEAIQKTENVTKEIEKFLDCDYSDYHRLTMLWKYFPDRIVWEVTDVHIIEAARELGEIWDSAFCPDCVVFLGKKFLQLPDEFLDEDIKKFRYSYGEPVMVLWREKYYILADSVKKAMETQSAMSFSAQVMMLNKGYECNLLSDEEQNFLLNWDAEKYRRDMK